MVGKGVPGTPGALLAQAVEETERRQRLEDRRPYRVEVDGAGHHRDRGLVGCELGDGDVADMEGLPGVLVLGGQTVEHVHFVP